MVNITNEQAAKLEELGFDWGTSFPTLAQAQTWICKNRNTIVYPCRDMGDKWRYNIVSAGYWFRCQSAEVYDSYEEALSAGITKYLNEIVNRNY